MSGRLYGCPRCGFTGKVPGRMDPSMSVFLPYLRPCCPCGGGEMQPVADEPARSLLGGAGRNRKPAVNERTGKERRRDINGRERRRRKWHKSSY